jgi:hypothetical protein
MLVPYVILYTGKTILFKRQPFVFLGKPMPITQGFLVRKKIWLIQKLRALLCDYIRQANAEGMSRGYLKDWEQKIYDFVLSKMDFVNDVPLMPTAWKNKVHVAAAQAVLKIVKQFLHKFVPFLLEHFHVDSYIDLLDYKLDIDIIESYFKRYLYRPLVLFFVGLGFLIGLGNAILYWIIA